MQKISVSIPGGNGRMGRTLIRLILENPKYKLSNATCLPGEEEEGVDIGLLVGKSKIENTLKSEESTTSHINIAKRCEGCWRSTPWTAHNRISWTDLESVKSPHSVRPRKEESKIKVQTDWILMAFE